MASQPTTQEAMIYLMVIMSASDREMRDEELSRIGAVVRLLPVFKGFNQSQTLSVAQSCQQLLHGGMGLDEMLHMIRDAIPAELRETAYAMAADVAAADLSVRDEETRILDLVKGRFGLDPLAVAAIERSVAIRHRELPEV